MSVSSGVDIVGVLANAHSVTSRVTLDNSEMGMFFVFFFVLIFMLMRSAVAEVWASQKKKRIMAVIRFIYFTSCLRANLFLYPGLGGVVLANSGLFYMVSFLFCLFFLMK